MDMSHRQHPLRERALAGIRSRLMFQLGENKVNLKLISAIAAGFFAAPAFAAPVTLDFEGTSSFQSIADYYNGGTDGNGASGTNYGASFGLDALAFQNDDLGTYFSNAPSGTTIMSAVGPDAALNVAAGFANAISFSYSSAVATTVSLFSGLNGTGDLLGTISLDANAQNGCSDSPFCYWASTTYLFSGIAKSIQFGSTANVAGFDDVSFAPVPVPAAGWLLMSGLGLVAGWRRRKNQLQIEE
jgi:hypothetical protein